MAKWRKLDFTTVQKIKEYRDGDRGSRLDLITTLTRYYSMHFSTQDGAKFNLIEKYYDKVSFRLREWHKEAEVKAKKAGAKILEDLNSDNPFLKLIPKNDGFKGAYLSILLIYPKKD